MIPHVVYRLWLGTIAIPAIFEAWWDSLRRFMPTWEFVTLREPPPRCITGNLISRCASLAAAVDVARLEWLAITGGVAVHCDVECVAAAPPWVDSFSCWTCQQESGAGNYAIGAVPNAAPIAATLRVIAERGDRVAAATPAQISAETGPERLNRAMQSVTVGTIVGYDAARLWLHHHASRSWLPSAGVLNNEVVAANIAGRLEDHMGKPCCGQSVVQKVAHGAVSAAKAIARIDTVSGNVARARRAECGRCDKAVLLGSLCGECGCIIKLKTALAAERCPIGKWEAIADAGDRKC